MPTSEEARTIIDGVLESHDCESSEGLIVAGGPASAQPHERGSGILKAGEPIVIDIFPRSK
jgi:Xaa-Pro aminopeptidase